MGAGKFGLHNLLDNIRLRRRLWTGRVEELVIVVATGTLLSPRYGKGTQCHHGGLMISVASTFCSWGDTGAELFALLSSHNLRGFTRTGLTLYNPGQRQAGQG